MITLYLSEPRDLPVVFPSDPLVPHGYTYADIDDISMCFKKNYATDADDAYLQKTQVGGGVTLSEVSHTFVMAVTVDDYGLLAAGAEYHLVLAVQVTGPSSDPWVELSIPDDRILVVTDKHRT